MSKEKGVEKLIRQHDGTGRNKDNSLDDNKDKNKKETNKRKQMVPSGSFLVKNKMDVWKIRHSSNYHITRSVEEIKKPKKKTVNLHTATET